MENAIAVTSELYGAQIAVATPTRGGLHYKVSIPGIGETVLERDVDFGKIPGTKSPSLYKAGAEKICMAYGLMQRYTMESKMEHFGSSADGDDPFFYYTVKCELVKLGRDGREYVFASSYGSCNTKEKRNGFKGAFDAANSTLKMSQKRALTSAALSVSGLSSMFTCDMEDENFGKKYDEVLAAYKNDKPSRDQMTALFSIASSKAGYSMQKTQKEVAKIFGIESIKEMSQAEYEKVFEWASNLSKEE